MLYDVTGHNVNEVYTNTSLIVSGNWAGTYGLTGAKSGGSAKIQCASDPKDKHPTFSTMPTLKKGHQYLLMISHFTNSQSGYSLSFGGGSAVITDTVQPHLKSANVECDRKTITVVLNKQMRCNSLAMDGSDFIIDSSPVTVSSASGANCGKPVRYGFISNYTECPTGSRYLFPEVESWYMMIIHCWMTAEHR